MNRIFWNGNESHSRNLGVSPAGMAVAHSSPSPSLPSQEQRAYESYVRFSRSIGAPALDFESWYRKDCGIGGTLFANYLQFHGETISDVGRHAIPWGIHGARVPVRAEEWDGAWDNAVKALEQ